MLNNTRGIILIGAPGAGKGTQARYISEKYTIPQISTGDIFRNEISNATKIGTEAQSFISKGLLVPDDIVIRLVAKRLSDHDCDDGYILDGFPRTLPQAKAMIESEITANLVLILDIKDHVIVRRLSGRRTCSVCNRMYHIPLNPPEIEDVCDACGGKLIIRKDDQPDTVQKRITVFRNQTAPLIDFYGKNEGFDVYFIDAGEEDSETPEIIFQRICKVLDKVKQ